MPEQNKTSYIDSEIKSIRSNCNQKTSDICHKIDTLIEKVNSFNVDIHVDKSRVDEIDKYMKKITQSIDQLTGILDKVDKENATQEFRINKLENDVSSCSTKVEEIFKYKYVIIGALVIISLLSTSSDLLSIVRMMK